MHQPRNFIYVLVLATILAVSPDRAWAHAIIVESTPKMNGVVTGPLLEVKLRFNSRIDGSRSNGRLRTPRHQHSESLLGLARPRPDFEMRDRADRGQSLAAKPK